MNGVYEVAKAETPRRDVDLFGPTTVRLDRGGVPILYLSAYVDDPDRLTQRLIGALAYLDDTQAEQAAHEQGRAMAPAPAPVGLAYSMPAYVEDVDYEERLPLAEKPEDTNWKAWAYAMVCRAVLATTAPQLASLEMANVVGLRMCPGQYRMPIGKALRDAYDVTQDQAAAA